MMTDIVPLDPFVVKAIAALAIFLGLLVATFLKAYRSDTFARAAKAEAEGIKADRQRTATERDEQFQQMREELAVLKATAAEHGKRLDEGDSHFTRVEAELKECNGLLRELLGMFKGSGRIKEN